MDSNIVLEILSIPELTLRLGGGLILLMLANILLGSVASIFDGTFDWKKFVIGIGRATVVVLSAYLIQLAGNLNADLMVISIGDELLNVASAIQVLLFGGVLTYAKQVFDKLKTYVGAKNTVKEILPEDGSDLSYYE
jgi:hypothetical protein